MAKEKISITIESSISKAIEAIALKENLSKSQLIENIIAQWQKEQKQRKMIEGYKAMAQENLGIAEDFSKLENEAWPND
jgi:hypothetical protein